MTSRRFAFLYFLILTLALFLRLFQLGIVPLSDEEATWALQAWQLARGQRPLLGPQAAYPVFTAVLFFLFGASNFLARLWPALTGVLLVWVPWLGRKRLGDGLTLVLAVGLAIDPGLVASARLAGSPMPAATFLVLAVVFWLDRRYALAGVCAGLALLTGPAVWFGMLTLTLTALVYALVMRAMRGGRLLAMEWSPLRLVWPWVLGVILMIGTWFGFFPAALGAAAAALPHFLRGWWTPAGVSLWQPSLALLADEALPLLFGLVAGVGGFVKKDRFAIALSLMALTAFLLLLLYPARQTAWLVWTILPLWVLAALEIECYLHWEQIDRRVALPIMAFTLLFLMLAWFMLAYATHVWIEGNLFEQPGLRMAAGVLLFLVVGLVLAGFSWEVRTVQCGGVLGLVAALGIAALGFGTAAVGWRHPQTVSLWDTSPAIGQADVLRQTVDQSSTWRKGAKTMFSLRVAGLDSPALHWLLRDYTVAWLEAPNWEDRPEALITPEGVGPQEGEYRGQDFVWRRLPRWSQATVLDWSRWLLFRTMPEDDENIVLWIRNDLAFSE